MNLRLKATAILAAMSLTMSSTIIASDDGDGKATLATLAWAVSPVIHEINTADGGVSGLDAGKVKYVIDPAAGYGSAVSGAYNIKITDKGVEVNAYDKAGEFYARQTMRQLFEAALESNGGILPAGEIRDWPDIARRGVIEGFYGAPWSHEVRLAIIDYMGRNKMDTYVYGPKDDPYHRTPKWREPYPEKEAGQIAELCDSCNRRSIDFVWAIHPGGDIRWNDADRDSLVAKFEQMYALGVRGFAVFFDDISGAGAKTQQQVDLLNYLTENFVKQKKDVADLIVCPTDYSRLWANPTERGQLATYGRTLDKSVSVFYTGDYVCSDLTDDTMQFVNNLIKRPAFYWWNFPVSDYCTYYMLLGPSYGLDKNIDPKEIGGFASNPMEHGMASLPALCGVADYCWNIKAFDPIRAWERGIADLAGDAYDAYRLFSIHSANGGKGYTRDESWETDTDLGNPIDWGKYDALYMEFEQIENAPEVIRRDLDDPLLLKEINPWLEQFGLLGTRGLAAMNLVALSEDATPEQIWQWLNPAVMTREGKAAFRKHSIGLKKLNPFINKVKDDNIEILWEKVTGEKPSVPALITSFKAQGIAAVPDDMLDHDNSTYYHSGLNMKPGEYIVLDLKKLRPVKGVEVVMGKDDKDDADVYPGAVVEYSADGKTYHNFQKQTRNGNTLTGELRQPVEARYIALKRTDDKEHNHWIAVRQFNVNTTDGADGKNLAAEVAPGTYGADVALGNQSVTFPVKKDAKKVMLLLAGETPVKVEFVGKRGKKLDTLDSEGSCLILDLPAKTTSVSLSSAAGNSLRGWTSF